MIVTAAFLLGTAYESCHNDDYDGMDPAGALFFLVAFLSFDYYMAVAL